jgi:hypothetical protein
MFSQILDQKTYLAVLNAAPDVPGEYDHIALTVVNKLFNNITPGRLNDFQYMKLSDLCIGFPEDYTNAKVGRIVTQLGLSKQRRRDGYYVFYTEKQIHIILDALKAKARS